MRVHKLCCEHYFSYPYSHKDENDKLDDEEVFNNELFMKIIETQIFTTTLYQGGLSNFTKVSWPEWDKFHTYKQVSETCDGDSDEALDLLVAFEEEFDIEISDEETKKLVYIKEIVNCIYTKILTS